MIWISSGALGCRWIAHAATLRTVTGSGGLHIKSDTVAKDGDFVGEQVIHIRECSRPETGIQQCVEKTACILRGRFDQDVEVKRGARHTVEDGGYASDDDVFHVMLLKRLEYVLQSVEHAFAPVGMALR